MAILGIFGGIFGMVVPLGFIALIVVAIVNRSKGGEHKVFESGVRIIFGYFFVIASLFIIVIGSIVAVNSLLNYYIPNTNAQAPILPIKTNISEISIYNEDYDKNIDEVIKTTTVKDSLDKAAYDKYYQEVALQDEKSNSMRDAATAITLVIVTIPIFICFSKLVKKHKEE